MEYVDQYLFKVQTATTCVVLIKMYRKDCYIMLMYCFA